jgi:hypothetical protein
LFFETARHGNVIRVHAGDKMPFGLGEAEIEGVGDLEIGLVFEYLEA